MADSMLPVSRTRDTGNSSRIALEFILNIYAAACVVVVARVVLLIGDVDPRVWIGRFVYRFTDPLVAPLHLLPGADRTIVGEVGLPDATLLAIMILIALGFSLRRGNAVADTGLDL